MRDALNVSDSLSFFLSSLAISFSHENVDMQVCVSFELFWTEKRLTFQLNLTQKYRTIKVSIYRIQLRDLLSGFSA